jgi:signal peptidase I
MTAKAVPIYRVRIVEKGASWTDNHYRSRLPKWHGDHTVVKRRKKAGSMEGQHKETAIEFLSSLAGVLATGFFIITFVVQAFSIPSSSMENTLLVGDHVFVNRIPFAPQSSWLQPLFPHSDIRRGDIVVFLSPQTPGLFVVKRIIGIPGDRIHLRGGVVYRNGVRLDEPYVLHDRDYPTDDYRDNFPGVSPPDLDPNVYQVWRAELPSHLQGEDIVVPPNAYFGMGDHRGVSLDSRFWGFIPRQNVIGRPMFVYWSFATPEDQYLKTSSKDHLEFLTHTIVHFFDETRWRRTLQVVR